MIKAFLMILCLLLPVLSFAQDVYTLRGSLVDSSGQAVTDGVIVLMNKSDSAQLKLDYFRTGTFEITWTDSQKRELLLYISAIGYNSKYVNVDQSHADLGEIILMPLAVYMDEVTVSVRKPIGHKFEKGRDEYTIPEWLSEQSYDLNSLLMMIPGLVIKDDEIEIAGIGKPICLINGLPPRSGELDNLNPKDIEKVSIVRMPGAKYSRKVIGVIDIKTKRRWHDYLSVRASNNFKYTNEVNNTSAVSVNFKKNKLSQFLTYNYNYSPDRYESWDTYETNIPDENIYYLMASDMEMYERSNKHTLIYSPKYQFNDYSFIDVQYLFLSSVSAEDNLTRTSFADESVPDLQSRMLGDGEQKGHYVTLRYDNRFGDSGKHRLTFNTSYLGSTDNQESTLEEESSLFGWPMDTTLTHFQQNFRNEVLTSSLDGKFTLWDVLDVETGVSYDNLWTKSVIDYHTKNYASRSRTRNEQLGLYLNTDHQIGRFHYQLGVRGEYERRHGGNAGGNSKDVFYFLPTIGASYRVDDNLNFMLYYRRTVDYPKTTDLNTNILYFHKYMYNTGNPSLKPSILNSLMARLAFPFDLTLTCKYNYKKNDIFSCTVTDKDNPNIIVLRPENLDKTHCLDLTLAWNCTFGCYDLNLTSGYLQYFLRSHFIEGTSFKPQFFVTANHSFKISPHIRAVVYMYYGSPYSWYNVAQRQKYSIAPQLYFNLLKNRLNIRIAADHLLHSGNNYTKDTYNHTTSIMEGDYHPRGISVGISYNFNNFMDLFQKNEAGSEMIRRTQTD